jgi:uncharacterized protein
MKKYITKSLVFIGTMMIGLLLTIAPASAHVVIDPSTATQGGYGAFSFRVPTESDTANTVKLQVKFDTSHPIASVRVEPKAGWTYSITTEKPKKELSTDDGPVDSVVSEITWEGGVIKPGEFDEFKVSMGPLPTDVASLQFKAIQTYSDGSTVSWIESASKDGEEAEHPAPTLSLTKPSEATHKSADQSDNASKDDSVNSAQNLARVSLVIAAVALAFGVIAFTRRK